MVFCWRCCCRVAGSSVWLRSGRAGESRPQSQVPRSSFRLFKRHDGRRLRLSLVPLSLRLQLPRHGSHHACLNPRGPSRPLPHRASLTPAQPFVLSNITAWCNACGNTIDSGCDLVYLANVSAQAALDSHTHAVGPVRAGFIGAGVTLGVGVVALGVLVLLGMASFGSRSGRSGRRAQDGVHLTRTKSVAGSF